jgi:hypothetical protein
MSAIVITLRSLSFRLCRVTYKTKLCRNDICDVPQVIFSSGLLKRTNLLFTTDTKNHHIVCIQQKTWTKLAIPTLISRRLYLLLTGWNFKVFLIRNYCTSWNKTLPKRPLWGPLHRFQNDLCEVLYTDKTTFVRSSTPIPKRPLWGPLHRFQNDLCEVLYTDSKTTFVKSSTPIPTLSWSL